MSRAAPPRRTLNEVLQVCVWSWPISVGFFGGGGLWAISLGMDHGNAVKRLGIALALFAAVSAFCFYLLDKVVSTPRRALIYFILLAALTMPLVVPTVGFLGGGYFILVPQPPTIRVLQCMALFFAAAVWTGIDLQSLRKRLVAKRYIDREFIEFDDHVCLRWEGKTDIEAPPISDRTFLGRVWNRHGLKLVLAIAPLSGAGYAMSRLLDRAGGYEAVLLFLAVLGVPLCIHVFSTLVCGAYLNVYKVWQVERKTGKPVLFDSVPCAK